MKKMLAALLAVTALCAFGINSASAAGAIHGVVVNAADDSPVAGAIVKVEGMQMERGHRPFMAKLESGEDGSFSVDEVPAGKYMIGAMAREIGVGMAKVEVADEAVDVTVKIGNPGKPDMQFGSLTGKVVDSDGNAVAGAKVMIICKGERGRNARHFKTLVTKTDDNGAFSFDKLPVGNFMIGAVARGVGAARDKVEIKADEQAEITLTLQAPPGKGDNGRGGRGGGGN